MAIRLVLGLGITVVMFAIAGRRFYWLYSLISSGNPPCPPVEGHPRADQGRVRRGGRTEEAAPVDGPGLAHSFTLWGFTILFLTIIEAYGVPVPARLPHSPDRQHRGHRVPRGLLRRGRGGLPDGLRRHPGEALAQPREPPVAVLRLPHRRGMAGPADDLRGHRLAAALPGRPGEHRLLPLRPVGLRLPRPGRVLDPLGTHVNSIIETIALLANIAIITGFLVFVSYSKHLHIFLAPINVATSRRPRALGALASTPDMSMEDVGEEDEVVFGAGRIEDFSWKQLLDMATCTECGRCQSQCPAWNTGKPLSPKLLIMDLRDNLFASADRVMAGTGLPAPRWRTSSLRSSTPTCCGPAPRAAPVSSSARWTSSTSTPSSTCAATRC